jgi:rod shape-determining protein MreB
MKKINFNKIFSPFYQDLAVDLGTANSLVYVKGKGIVIQEPSVVAINQKTGQILAIGREAKIMVGRTPGHILAVKPLVRGVISDFEVTEQMLKYFFERTKKNSFSFLPVLPRVVIGIPCGTTEVERRAVERAARSAGAKEVYLIEEPIAAAIGAKLPIQEAKGIFIIDIGGGTTEVAVISLGGIVTFRSLKIAGDQFNHDIIQYIQQKYKLLIGERTAEEAKIAIGSAISTKEDLKATVRGRNLITGLPDEIIITSEDVKRAIEKSLSQIIEAIKTTIDDTPPEILSDVMQEGIYLVGGGALLRNIDILIKDEIKMPVKIIDDPLTAVVRGGGVVIENLDKYREVLTKNLSEELS